MCLSRGLFCKQVRLLPLDLSDFVAVENFYLRHLLDNLEAVVRLLRKGVAEQI